MNKICSNCGRQNKAVSKFCMGCGGELEEISSWPLSEGTILAERYKIIKLIKAGGMGAIYKALDDKLERTVAIKELLPVFTNVEEKKKSIKWFRREAKILARLEHPNLPGVFDYFVEDNKCYLAMTLIEGEDLETILRRDGTPGLEESKVVSWTKDILNVLEYLHSQDPPVIYRDLKPSNIMLRKDGRIVLVDFGLARTAPKDSDTEKTIIGTSGYAPPEQCMGKVEPRSDLYSLGATMHHLLTGITPAPFSFKPLKKINPLISSGVENVVMKSLERSPHNRFQSAGEMKENLSPQLAPPTVPLESKKVLPGIALFASGAFLTVALTVIGIILVVTGGLYLKFVYYNPAYYIEIGKEALDDKNYSKAKRYYESAYKLDEDNMDILLTLAEIEVIQKNYDEAIYYYNKAGHIYPVDPEILKGLFYVYMASKDYRSAKDKLDSLYELGEKKYDEYFELACIFTTKGAYDEAIYCFEKVLEVKPGDMTVYRGLSKCYMKKNDYDAAIKINKEILNMNDNDIDANMNMGFACYGQEDYKRAIEYFKKTLLLGVTGKDEKEVNSGLCCSYLKEGETFLEQGDYVNGIKSFKKSLNLDKDNIDSQRGLAFCYFYEAKRLFDDEKYSKGKKYLASALSFDSDEIRNQIGTISLTEGKKFLNNKEYYKAKAVFEEILEFDSGGYLGEEAKKCISEIEAILEASEPPAYINEAGAVYSPPADADFGEYSTQVL